MISRVRASTVDAIARDLASSNTAVRIEAADNAASVVERDESTRERIIAMLVRTLDIDGTPNVRAAAALALADLKAHEALPALLMAADDDAPLVRQLAITALGEIQDPRARERIRRALKDERPEVRFQAVVAFPRLCVVSGKSDDDAWEALGEGLDDDDAQVRGRAAEACAELADGADLPAAIADRLAKIAVDKKDTSDARVAAAIALGESGDTRGGRVLLDVMKGDIPEPDAGRVQAAFELAGELDLEGAHSLASSAAFGLRAYLGDPSRRTSALVALVRLRDPRAIEAVLKDLAGRSFSRRALAIGIVGRAALPDARPHLESLREVPKLADPGAVADALARIEAGTRKKTPTEQNDVGTS